MHLHHHLRILAATATLAAVTAPTASASEGAATAAASRPANHHAVAGASHDPNPTDWELIALASGGTIALLGTALTSRRRRGQRSHRGTAATRSRHLSPSPATTDVARHTRHTIGLERHDRSNHEH